MATDTARRPVVYRGERLPGLFERSTTDGRTVYELRRKVDGRSLRRALEASTVTDAIREARALATTIDQGARPVGRTDASLAELRREYEAWGRGEGSKRIASSTLGLYLSRLDLYVLPELGATTKAAAVTPAQLRAMIERCAARKVGKTKTEGGARKPGRPVAGSTVRGCVTATSALFRFAVHRGIIDRNPCRDLEHGDRPSGKRRTEPRYLDAGQIVALLGELGDEFRPIAACCAYGAMRIGEALALTWADVDFAAGMIAVPGTKTAASRQPVPMIETLAAELKAHRAAQAALSFARVKPAALVFQTATGQPQHRKNALRAVWRAGTAAGLNPDGVERVGLHDLRHSCAGLLLANGTKMPKVAAVLRHSSPRITADVYAGLVETERAELGVDLTAAFGGTTR